MHESTIPHPTARKVFVSAVAFGEAIAAAAIEGAAYTKRMLENAQTWVNRIAYYTIIVQRNRRKMWWDNTTYIHTYTINIIMISDMHDRPSSRMWPTIDNNQLPQKQQYLVCQLHITISAAIYILDKNDTTKWNQDKVVLLLVNNKYHFHHFLPHLS